MNLETLSLDALRLVIRSAMRDVVKDAIGPAVVRKALPATITKSTDREFRFTISTGQVDRDNDIIDPAGVDLTNYKKNPVVLWAHSHDVPPIGKALSITRSGNSIVSVVQFPPAGVHPLADQVRELVAEGFLNSASIGFTPIESSFNKQRGGIDFKRIDLHEWSVVPVPANPGAVLQRAVKSIDGMDPRVLRELVRGLVRAEVR